MTVLARTEDHGTKDTLAIASRRHRVGAGVGAILLLAGVAIVAYLSGAHQASHPRSRTTSGALTQPGTVDVGFSQDMATHHDQAVLMANLAISRGGLAVRGIADTILTNQSQEIGQLRGWLQQWKQPAADAHPMGWMSTGAMSAGHRHSMAGDTMPGMASASQLATLYRAQGKRFDVLFLQLMIHHHQGGIGMAHYAEQHAGSTIVRSAATAMRVEQVQDLAQMMPLLHADHGRELPAP